MNDIENLQQLLAKCRNPNMDKKYSKTPWLKDITSLKEDIKQNNFIYREDFKKLHELVAYAIVFGIYEYFNKIKSTKTYTYNMKVSLQDPLTITKVTQTKENKYQINLFSKLIHQTKLKTVDFKEFGKIDLFLPDSVYSISGYSESVLIDYRPTNNYNRISFFELSELLGVFMSDSRSQQEFAAFDTTYQELLIFVESLIKEFMKYCPPTPIDLYLKTAKKDINTLLRLCYYENISEIESELNKQLSQVKSMISPQLMELTRNRVRL